MLGQRGVERRDLLDQRIAALSLQQDAVRIGVVPTETPEVTTSATLESGRWSIARESPSRQPSPSSGAELTVSSLESTGGLKRA